LSEEREPEQSETDEQAPYEGAVGLFARDPPLCDDDVGEQHEVQSEADAVKRPGGEAFY
jgi:hypothetical protein